MSHSSGTPPSQERPLSRLHGRTVNEDGITPTPARLKALRTHLSSRAVETPSVDVLPGMNAGASTSAVPSPIEGSGTAWVLLGAWALSPARPTPIHPRPERRGFSALSVTDLEHGRTIAFKKKIIRQMHLSSLGQFGRQAAERQDFFRCIGKLEQCLLDLLRQGLKRRKVVEVRVLLFDLLPEFLNGVIVR